MIKEDLVHNNEIKETSCSIYRQEVNNSAKRKAQEDICEKPAKLIHKEIASTTNNVGLGIREANNIKKNIYILQGVLYFLHFRNRLQKYMMP